MVCGCTGYSIEEISPNLASYETLTEHSTCLHECPKQGCLHTSATATQVRQHVRVHARGNSNRLQVFCHQCSLGFVSEACLTRHIGRVPRTGFLTKVSACARTAISWSVLRILLGIGGVTFLLLAPLRKVTYTITILYLLCGHSAVLFFC